MVTESTVCLMDLNFKQEKITSAGSFRKNSNAHPEAWSVTQNCIQGTQVDYKSVKKIHAWYLYILCHS